MGTRALDSLSPVFLKRDDITTPNSQTIPVYPVFQAEGSPSIPIFESHGPDYITISWKDGSPINVTTYLVQSRKICTLDWDNDVTDENVFTKYFLLSATTYEFRVAAVKPKGMTPFSRTVSYKTAHVIPGQPGGLKVVSKGLYTAEFQWDKPVDLPPEISVKGFDVQLRRKGAEAFVSFPTTQPSYQVDNLAAGTEYTVRVACQTADDIWTAYCQEVEFETGFSVPDVITTLRATSVGHDYIVFKWTPPPDNGRPILGYQLECRTSSVRGASKGGWATETIDSGTCDSFTMAGLEPAQVYIVRVRCRSEKGYSEWSEAIDFLTEHSIPGAPSTPQLVQVNADYIRLTWSPPDGRGSPISRYFIQYRRNGSITWVTENTTSTDYKIGKLVAATEYSFRLYCQNSEGQYGPFSEIVNYCTLPSRPEQCEAPTPLVPGHHSMILQWTIPYDNHAGIHKYEVKWRKSVEEGDKWRGEEIDKPTKNVLDSSKKVRHTVENLTPNTTYIFVVRACNNHGWGAYSNRTVATTDSTFPTKPDAPEIVKTDCEYIKLLLCEPVDNGHQITWYKVEWQFVACLAEGGGGAAATGSVVTAQSSEWRLESWNALSTTAITKYPRKCVHYTQYHLPAGATYRFRFACQNEKGTSEWSECVEGSTACIVPFTAVPAIDVKPKGVNGNDVLLFWYPVHNNGRCIQRYQVKYKAEGTVGDWKLCTRPPQTVFPAEVACLKYLRDHPFQSAEEVLPFKRAQWPPSKRPEFIGILLENLQAGTTYSVVARAENAIGWSPLSEEITFTTNK